MDDFYEVRLYGISAFASFLKNCSKDLYDGMCVRPPKLVYSDQTLQGYQSSRKCLLRSRKK